MELSGQLQAPAATYLPFLPLQRLEPRFLRCPACTLFIISAKLSRLAVTKSSGIKWVLLAHTEKKFHLHNSHPNKNVGGRLVIANMAAFSDTYIMENSRERNGPLPHDL